MAVTLNKANLVLKDANGNIGKIEQLSNRDLAKIKTAVSDVALVVNQSNHTPIEATTTNKGVVQLATSADVVSGASDKVVTAEQLHNATIGTTSALATENLARIDAVVTEAGIPIDHTNTNQLKTAVTTLVNNAKTDASQKYLPLTGGNLTGNLNIASSDGESILKLDSEQGSIYLDASSNIRGLFVKNVDNNPKVIISITRDGTATFNGTALNAMQDGNGRNIADTYLPLTGGALTGSELKRNVDSSLLKLRGGIQSCADLSLWGSASSYSGYFMLDANNGTNVTRLQGTPAGSLTWDTKEIERVELKGSNYIRYSSGLTLMWGTVVLPAGTKKQDVNLPIPFNSTYVVSLTVLGNYQDNTSGEMISYQATIKSLSTFGIQHTWEESSTWQYLAVGY